MVSDNEYSTMCLLPVECVRRLPVAVISSRDNSTIECGEVEKVGEGEEGGEVGESGEVSESGEVGEGKERWM